MQGSIKKYKGKDGTVTWRAVVDLPREPGDQRRRQKRLSAPTKKEVEEKVAKLLARPSRTKRGEKDAEKMPMTEYLHERWLPTLVTTVRPNTLSTYKYILRAHFEPTLGDVMLANLGAVHVQKLYAERLASGLSSTSLTLLHRVLRRALGQAVLWGMIDHNPTDGVESPRARQVEYTTWNAEQASKFLKLADDDKLAALWRLALLTGMRRGEILGLHWDDINLATGNLSVTRTIICDARGKAIEGTPKTARGRRQVALPKSVALALTQHKQRQKDALRFVNKDLDEQGYVFSNAAGGPLYPPTVVHYFHRLVEEAKLPYLRFHDLRHTCATLMLANGEHPKIVQERLGHANVGMTLSRYSHVTPDMQREAADKLDKLIEGAS